MWVAGLVLSLEPSAVRVAVEAQRKGLMTQGGDDAGGAHPDGVCCTYKRIKIAHTAFICRKPLSSTFCPVFSRLSAKPVRAKVLPLQLDGVLLFRPPTPETF
ncbi:trypsin-3-like [Platysternon megacephalum]|uniref:Trypsin-3-like n=1 Tax=Platysternon megacephalum TaxID=55544 RepID=A0A4D9F7Q7_9SAUR|nr:trypsin-3-like [Platysternon megacephalum]